MLAAEALRLAAIEVLRPTAAVEAGEGFPTLAGLNVLDSREIAVQDIDRDKPYTPILVLHTAEAGVALRGALSSAEDTAANAALDIVAELAVVENDKDGEFADALAASDPEARLVLAALCSQVRYLLERSQAGGLWRRLVRRIVNIEYQPFEVPNIGMRWQRITMRFHCEIRDDDFEVEGLPEPMATVYAALPSQSYAKAKLASLASHFSRDVLPRLEGVDVDTGDNMPGFKVDFP
ncbi:hypothetical protein HGP14_02900 [Rhizobium sp. P32RR-XVIII]|uniref:hypothetical protein n=1 Tax=Rhizobium sp. P32RR-XVIII TaxID=2726738 RepID=UPI001456618E|nr:hypothetical protein [Rhizobium sp. P32RR-XVIII]NLS02318.1 hypothetical protein [Rhizobium sp. P32RR-XVIII]